jgi:Asp-tRNA(Asn)/Glu-tRNA(Gln) amidotransferase B subunit
LAETIGLIDDGTIGGKIAKGILPELLTQGGSAKEPIDRKGLVQISDMAELEKIIDEVIAASPKELEQYRSVKTKLLGFFVGQVMKKPTVEPIPNSLTKSWLPSSTTVNFSGWLDNTRKQTRVLLCSLRPAFPRR